MRSIKWLVLLLVSLSFVACSTPETRSKERPDSFSRLSKDEQRLALKGKISEGMSQDAVYIAMGNPYKKRKGRFQGKETLAWIYGTLEAYTFSQVHEQFYRDSKGRLFSTPVYDPVTEYRTVETFAVFFDQGRVVGWQEL